MEWLFYIVSMIYTIVLVVTVGLILFETYFVKDVSQNFLVKQQAYRKFAVKLLFFMVLISIFEQIIMWLDLFGAERFNFTQMFLETTTGQVWIALLVLSIIGLLIQKLPMIYLAVWAVALLLVESFDGHIAALDGYALVFDFVHLLCVALWVGGIITFILQWKRYKEELLPLLQSFMKVIWLSIIVMSLSGIALALMILPDYLYLLYSSWGQWLLVKVALVIIAVYCGYQIRGYVKKHNLPIVKALRIEGVTLLLVLAITGVITTISPEPSPNSLNKHVMGEELHYTVEISPNRPGPNDYAITLWTLENEGEVASVEVELKDLEKGERSKRIMLTLTKADLSDPYDFMGFVESRYEYDEQLRLPYPSKWQQHVTITFENGIVRTFTMDFEN